MLKARCLASGKGRESRNSTVGARPISPSHRTQSPTRICSIRWVSGPLKTQETGSNDGLFAFARWLKGRRLVKEPITLPLPSSALIQRCSRPCPSVVSYRRSNFMHLLAASSHRAAASLFRTCKESRRLCTYCVSLLGRPSPKVHPLRVGKPAICVATRCHSLQPSTLLHATAGPGGNIAICLRVPVLPASAGSRPSPSH